MKRLLQLAFVALSFLFANQVKAQLPDFGVYQGGLVLESYQPSANYSGNHVYDMGSWDVDSTLDAGTPVVLDLFAVWCAPCWSGHTGGTLENLYDSKGYGGSKEVAIFAVETDGNTAPMLLEGGGTSKGDWINNTKYPMINNDGAGALFNLSYFPTIVIVCPDRTVTELGINGDFVSAIAGCGSKATATNDVRLLDVDTKTVYACQATTVDATISANFQNYSKDSVNGSYEIELMNAASEVLLTKTTEVHLKPYEVVAIELGVVTSEIGANTYTAKITSANDETSNDTKASMIKVEQAKEVLITSDKKLTIKGDLDAYASEFGYALLEGIPPTTSLVDTWNNLDVTSALTFAGIKSIADGTKSFEHEATLNDFGCHYMIAVDFYGDGIVYENSNGGITLKSDTEVKVSGDWGQGAFFSFDFVEAPSGVAEDSNVSKFEIFPNPVVDIANISLALEHVSDVTISVLNTIGQTIYTEAIGRTKSSNIQINTSAFSPGVYLIKATVDGVTTTRKMSVVK